MQTFCFYRASEDDDLNVIRDLVKLEIWKLHKINGIRVGNRNTIYGWDCDGCTSLCSEIKIGN